MQRTRFLIESIHHVHRCLNQKLVSHDVIQRARIRQQMLQLLLDELHVHSLIVLQIKANPRSALSTEDSAASTRSLPNGGPSLVSKSIQAPESGCSGTIRSLRCTSASDCPNGGSFGREGVS